MGKNKVFGAQRVQLPYWKYLGGQTITNPDGQALTIPSETTIVEIASEDGKCYWDFQIASVNSPGYVPSDGREIIGPSPDIVNGMWVHGASAIVHVTYWKEV